MREISGDVFQLYFCISWLKPFFRYGLLSLWTSRNCYIGYSEQSLTADKSSYFQRLSRSKINHKSKNWQNCKEHSFSVRRQKQTSIRNRSKRCNLFRKKSHILTRFLDTQLLQNGEPIVVTIYVRWPPSIYFPMWLDGWSINLVWSKSSSAWHNRSVS